MTFAYLRHVLHSWRLEKIPMTCRFFAIWIHRPSPHESFIHSYPATRVLTVEKQAMERNAISKIASSSDANDERHRRCTNGLGKFISKLSQLHYTLQFIWWSFSTWCICFVNWQYWQYWQYVEKERDNSHMEVPKIYRALEAGKIPFEPNLIKHPWLDSS